MVFIKFMKQYIQKNVRFFQNIFDRIDINIKVSSNIFYKIHQFKYYFGTHKFIIIIYIVCQSILILELLELIKKNKYTSNILIRIQKYLFYILSYLKLYSKIYFLDNKLYIYIILK